MPKEKWRTQDRRVKNFTKYLSRKDRLGSIYGDIQIDVINIDLPIAKLGANGMVSEFELRKITNQYREDYNILAVVFADVEGSRYKGAYYPNTSKTDTIMDTYILTDENTIENRLSGRFKAFERRLEHEIAGHGASLDLGLTNQGNTNEYKVGSDNTHSFFYDKDRGGIDQYYKELNELWVSQRSIFQKLIDSIADVIAKLPKKNSSMKIKVIGPDTEMMKKADTLVEIMKLLGKDIRITESYRSCERQNALYAQGRTTVGSIVTNAKCGESYHNYGLAFDVVFRETGYNAPEADWQLLGTIGKALSLNWGGDWKGFVDRPHFEVKMTLKEIREKYEL